MAASERDKEHLVLSDLQGNLNLLVEIMLSKIRDVITSGESVGVGTLLGACTHDHPWRETVKRGKLNHNTDKLFSLLVVVK